MQAQAAPAWADLPPALWEAVADRLPAADIMSLRQAWRGASQLGARRLCSEVCGAAGEELWGCISRALAGAFMTATEGIVTMAVEANEVSIDFLCQFMQAVAHALAREGRMALVQDCAYLGERPGRRLTYELDAPHAGMVLQSVMTIAESSFPDEDAAAVDFEEFRFLTAGGRLLAEYSLAHALDNSRKSTRAIRLADGTGFGRLQGRPLAGAPAHFAALHAAAERQPLRVAAGGWADGLLLPATLEAVKCMYPLQL